MSTREERWQGIDASVARVRPLFWTITGEDFGRSIRWARSWAGRNRVREDIRARAKKNLDVELGKSQPETVGRNP